MNNKTGAILALIVVVVLVVVGAVWWRHSRVEQYTQGGGTGSTSTTGGTGTTGGGGTQPTGSGNFNTLNPTVVAFDPGSLSGMPDLAGTNKPSVGQQGGDFVDGKALYYPWSITAPPTGGGNLKTAIGNSTPQGIMISYNGGTNGFADASNWTYFDMTKLPIPAKGYNAAVVVGNDVYLVPAGASTKGGNLPVFVKYDATKAVNDPSAYQEVATPARGGAFGSTYAWCSGMYDGRYIYYVPDQDSLTTDLSGNVIRYDTQAPFTANGGGWSHFDMSANVNSGAGGFQSGAYDGHRYIYFIPFRKALLVRYDTQYGTPGTPNPSAFTNPKAYTTMDPTKLGTGDLPPITGDGSVSKMAGFTGAQVVWDSAHQNEYLYFVPWAVFTPNQELQSTAARVRIGTQSGNTWTAVDIMAADSSTPTPNWEMYDLNNLTKNPQWQANGWPYPAVYPANGPAPLVGQSVIAGFQLSWVNTAGPGAPRVGFGANDSQFWVEHSVDSDLSDPSGWYVAKGSSSHSNGTFGGAYDTADQIFYPSPPSAKFIQVKGL